ncbi:glycosyltransferase family 4 protein [Geomonas agri]|uniref:glycosyltransferase family 4 protein n=1 Tax=Geomonas agri TaxID=2873702 RepID=UPI001CD5F916|nr:glycosyltransferase family 4 protein [Geomonas agri]
MKILLVNNDKGWSGGQEHLSDLSRELTRLGVEVHFVVREGGKSESRFRAMGHTVHAMPRHGVADVLAPFQLASVMRRERFDVVSVNREHDLLLTALAWHLAFPFKKKGRFMMSYHTATKRRQLMLNTADAVLCISEHVKVELLKQNQECAAKLEVVHYGIALGDAPGAAKFDRDRPRRFFTGVGFPLIGMVGEFWKNQEELVRMIPALREAFPGIKVAFVGDDSDRTLVDPLQSLARQLGVDDALIFTGRIPRDRIPDVFYDFDLSVTTHRNEGFGIVHLESLAAGTPVVTYDEGGMVDIFRGEDAGVVVTGAEREFAAAVIALLHDDQRRFAMGSEGYRLVQRKYSLQAMGQRYLDYYHRLLAGRS